METTYGPKPMKPMSITRFTEITGVRNLKVTWQEVEGRKTLKLDFTEDAAGTPQQLEPMPGSNEAALSPAYKKAGLLPPDIWNNARRGHPKAMLACGFLMLGEREFDAAVDWFLMAANAGEEEGTKFVAILFREHGYRPSSSAGEEQIRAWNSWNKVVEQLMQLEPETLEAMARVLELPPEARKQATNAHPSFWPDQGNEDFTLECVRAALARIQAASESANRKER
jgi:hypothetical protein